jgi:molybdopterin molybdotransferase
MSAIGFDQALRTILSAVRPLPREPVPLFNALNRIAASRVAADEDAVPYARSAMDGYAVRAADCATATPSHPCELLVAGKVFAEKGESALAPGTALAITTGAPIPRGADAVIPHEKTESSGAWVRIFAPVSTGDCVFPSGEDLRRGDEILAAGETITAGKLALLAFAGKSMVSVFRRPRVAIVCTGNELVDVEAIPARGQVRNSNAVALSALVLTAGGDPQYAGVAPDDPAELAAMLERARRGADLLITTGGASRGERDFVKSVLTQLGAEFHFTQVAMRPGRPFGFAQWRGLPVCVLPGNPAAAFVCFQKLVRPLLAGLSGRGVRCSPSLRARLDADLHSRSGRRYFVLARVRWEPEGFIASPLANQCSALVRTSADANAIITVYETPAGSITRLHSGDSVDVELFDGPEIFCASTEAHPPAETPVWRLFPVKMGSADLN